jgi:hypothetical protein
MELPDDVLQIIRDYSMPLTRSDWRTLHIMPYVRFIMNFHVEYQKRNNHLRKFPPWLIGKYKDIFSEANYRRIIYL